MSDKFDELADEADQVGYRHRDIDMFFNIREIFQSIIYEKIYIDALNSILRDVAKNSIPVTARTTAGSFILLRSSEILNWSLIFHHVTSQYLYLTPVHAFQAPVSVDHGLVTIFKIDHKISFDTFEPGVTLDRTQSLIATSSSIIAKDGRSEILDWTPANNGICVTLRVNSEPLERFEWSFDRSSGRALGIGPIDALDSNLTTTFDLIAAVGSRSSLEAVEPFTVHPAHYVRWKAIQTLATICPDAGRAALLSAHDDIHPEVREAARRTEEALSV